MTEEIVCDANESQVEHRHDNKTSALNRGTKGTRSEEAKDGTQSPENLISHAVNASNGSQASRRERLFGMRKSRRKRAEKQAQGFGNSDDYELKYPEDEYGEEAGSDARVWRVYLDEARKFDAEMVDSWQDTTDILLVFAGLFSAVVTSFVITTSSALQPDLQLVTASLLQEQIQILRAIANGTVVGDVPASSLNLDSPASPTASDKWVNGLWFTSLSFSLATALVAVLVKQWIQHYRSQVYGTPLEQVRIRQFRYFGVERWHVPHIIGLMPMFLHAALFLYFAGLIIILLPLDAIISYTTIVIAGASFAFYITTLLLPVCFPECPYKTPLISFAMSLLHYFKSALSRIKHYYAFANDHPQQSLSPSSSQPWAKKAEDMEVSRRTDEIDARAVHWLYTTSSNPSVRTISVESIAGLRHGFSKFELLPNFTDYGIVEEITRWTKDEGFSADEAVERKVERLGRAQLRLCPRMESIWYELWHLGDSLGEGPFRNQQTQILRDSVVTDILAISSLFPQPLAPTNIHASVWNQFLIQSYQNRGDAEDPRSVFQALYAFFTSFNRRDPFDSIDSWAEKCAMLFERLAPLDQYIPPFEAHIYSPILFDVIPVVYSVLASALEGYCATAVLQGPQEIEPDYLHTIFSGLMNLCSLYGNKHSFEGASTTNTNISKDERTVFSQSIQHVIGSEIASFLSMQDLQTLHICLFTDLRSKSTPWKLQQLMNYVIDGPRPLHAVSKDCLAYDLSYSNDFLNLHLLFAKYAKPLHHFVERTDMESVTHILDAYLLGMEYQPSGRKVVNLERAVQYIFDDDHFAWFLGSYTFLHICESDDAACRRLHKKIYGLHCTDCDGRYSTYESNKEYSRFSYLFSLRPYDLIWTTAIARLHAITTNPQKYRRSPQSCTVDTQWSLRRIFPSMYNVRWLTEQLNVFDMNPNPDLDFLIHVHGLDIDDDPSFGNWKPIIRDEEGLPMFAPYAVIFPSREVLNQGRSPDSPYMSLFMTSDEFNKTKVNRMLSSQVFTSVGKTIQKILPRMGKKNSDCSQMDDNSMKAV